MRYTNVIVFIDFETDSTDPVTTQPIQIAAIACDRATLEEIEVLNVKVHFDIASASPDALSHNHFSADVWQREAIDPFEARGLLVGFFKRHATLVKTSGRTGRPYTTCELAGHNIAMFDAIVLESWWERMGGGFLPATCYTSGPVDTMQMARSIAFARNETWDAYNLDALCRRFGIVNDKAHDALADVRATIQIAKALRSIALGVSE